MKKLKINLGVKILENNKDENNLHEIDITSFPITTNSFTWFPMASLVFLVLNILSFLMPGVLILTFYTFGIKSPLFPGRMYLIFIDIFAWWGSYILTSLLFAKLFLIILKLIHHPVEGLFEASRKNKDYYFYCLRIVIKKYVFWVWNNFCFPWASTFAFKMCNIRVDFKSTIFDGWVDGEFIELGNNMMVGQGAVILSSIFVRIDNKDYLLVKKVIIGDHVVLGGHSIVAPGTIIGKGTTLGIWAMTHIGQILEPDYIYIGKPARKYQPAQKAVEESRQKSFRRNVDTGEREPFDIYRGIMKDEN